MSEINENQSRTSIIPVDFGTINIKLVPIDKITLPVEAAGELSKDYAFIDKLLHVMVQDTRQEVIEQGDVRLINTIINPHMIQWMNLKLKYLQTIWKISGGEIDNEAKKQTMKMFSDILYNSLKDNPEAIEKAKELWKKQYSPANLDKQ